MIIRKSMNKKRIPWFKILMILGCLLVTAAILITAYNLYTDYSAGANAEDITRQINEQVDDADETDKVDQATETNVAGSEKTIGIDGYEYIGTIDIPVLGLELPVMNNWSYTELNISPCRYEGTVGGGDLIIAGHDYMTHFGKLNKLQIGDEVDFTDADGQIYRYDVSGIETINKYDVQEMESGDWDLTLFTCNLSGNARVTIRCTIIESN